MIKRVFKIDHTRIDVTLSKEDLDITVNVSATGDMLLEDFMALAASIVSEVNVSYGNHYSFTSLAGCNDLVDS